ncbi:MAG: hypothetical protein ACP5UD_09270 [Conexivisphaera sp.]
MVRKSLPPRTPATVVAVVMENLLRRWTDRRKCVGEGAGTASVAGKLAQGDLEEVLSGLRWHRMKQGDGEWTFATYRDGSPRPGLAGLLEELRDGRRLRIGGYDYSLSGKFLHRFPTPIRTEANT